MRIQELKAYLRANLPVGHQNRCPYCRLAHELPQFDHVLEKAKVPELAFYYRNLVPSCDTCNNRRDSTFDSQGQQRVIHFYDDDVDAIPDVLRARLVMNNGRPAASFFLESPLPHAGALYARHFASLKLADRYRQWAFNEMNDVRDWLASCEGENYADVLTKRAEQSLARWGNNEPTTTLYRALAARTDIVHNLVQT
jgi:hypothetical protein